MARNDKSYSLGRLLTPGEVAKMFRVDPKTVTRWAAAGRLSSVSTPGGHRRFWENEVYALASAQVLDPAPLESFARWVASLGDGTVEAMERRKKVTLTEIIDRASAALEQGGNPK
jgi:excisionase family DNA binding protein